MSHRLVRWPYLVGLVVGLLGLIAVSCRSGSTPATAQPTATGEALTASDVGITPSEVLVGTSQALTGPAALTKSTADGIRAYFEYVNANGGVHGRKLRLVVKDNAYDPAKAVAVAREMVTQDKVFAVIGQLGTPPNVATYQYYNEQQVPDVFLISGDPRFNDPKQYPYVSRFFPSYPQEAELFWKYIQSNLPGKRVAVLYQNDDFGKSFLKRFDELAGGAVVAQAGYETAATDISSQMTSLKQSGADVLVQFVTPKFAILALKFIQNSGWKVANVMSSVNVDPAVVKIVGPQTLEGTVTSTVVYLLDDASAPQVTPFKEALAKYAPGVEPSIYTEWGFTVGQLFVDALKQAGRNPTRASLLKALENLRSVQTLLLVPVSISTSDHAAARCERLTKYESGRFHYIGEAVCATTPS